MGSRLRDRKRRHDAFYKRAKGQSYAARSVFKLQQIDERFTLLRPRQNVLDLGCRPGSWMQYAAQRVGPEGNVVGLDRQPLEIALAPNMRQVVGDVLAIDPGELRDQLSSPADPPEDRRCFQVVLSDMAPDTTGIAFTDQVRSVELFSRALELAEQIGCPSSSFVGKIFMGEGFAEVIAEVKRTYRRVKTVRPEATRKRSTELYVVARERRPTAG